MNTTNESDFIRKDLPSIIESVLKGNIVKPQLQERISKVRTEDLLLEDVLNCLYDFSGSDLEFQHLANIKAWLDGKKDLYYDSFIQKRHRGYKNVKSFLAEFLDSKTQTLTPKYKEKIESLRSKLSPLNSLDLIILDVLSFIEHGGNTQAEVDVRESPLEEEAVCSGYVEKVLEVLNGDRPYRLFSAYSKDGRKYSTIRIL